jgi:hypothetical protein
MKEWWEIAKESLEANFQDEHKVRVPFTDSEVFKGILKAWESGEAAMIPMLYVLSFSEADIEAMKMRKQ